MPELIGRTLGHYRIVEQIGEGGMAAVYRAYQPALDRYVALKLLPPVYAAQPGFSERFRREARAIANLHHPNILPVYDFGQEDDYSYIAMRYVEGARTLKTVMSGPLDLAQVADLIGQIAEALDHAHRRGIIHRDVKPSNVLMDGDWVLLTDFGLAKMTEASVQLTGSGVGVGTPAYMSPEQGQGLQVDARSDVYSLGVILFEMLTGQIPHNAETPFAIVLRRVTEPLPMPRTINPGIPEAVERVILKALARDPDDRFPSACEMAEALKEAVAPEGATQVFPAGAPAIQTLATEEVLEPGVQNPLPATVQAGLAAEQPPATDAAVPSPVPVAGRRAFPWRRVAYAGLAVLALGIVAAVVAIGWWRGIGLRATPSTPIADIPHTPLPAPTATQPATPLPSPAEPGEAGTIVRLRVRVTSSSDQTAVTFASVSSASDTLDVTLLSDDSVVEQRTVETGGEVTRAGIEGRTIYLEQETARAEAGNTVHIVQEVALAGVAEDQLIALEVQRNCIGVTLVEVANLVTGKPLVVDQFYTQACETEVMPVEVSRLVTSDPGPTPTPLSMPSLLTVRMWVRLTSGSDWSNVELGTAGQVAGQQTVETGGKPTNAGMADKVIALDQDIARAEAGNTVYLVQEVTLSSVPQEEPIWFSVSKGCIGEMTVEVYNVMTDEPLLVERAYLPECDPEVFLVYPEVFVTEDPPPTPTPLPTPHPGLSHLEQGLALYWDGEWEAALGEMDQALSLGLDTAEMHYHYAQACREVLARDGDCSYEAAAASYDRAIELEPHRAEYWRERGWFHSDHGELDEARADFDRALELDPQDCLAYWGRAIVHRSGEAYQAAVDDLTQAIELCPDIGALYVDRAWLYYEHLGDSAAALEDLSAAIEGAEHEFWAFHFFQRGLLYARLGRDGEARADMERAVEIADADPSQSEWGREAQRWLDEHPE